MSEGVFITETQRSTEGHRGLQNPGLKTTRHAEICVARAVPQEVCSGRPLWPSVLLCVSVIKPRPLPPSAFYFFAGGGAGNASSRFLNA